MPDQAGTDHPFLDDDSPALLGDAGGDEREGRRRLSGLDWRQKAGGAALVAGFATLLLGWWGVSGTLNTSDQLSYLLSGGLVGAALVATGLTMLVTYEHAADRTAIARLESRLTKMEDGLAGEFDAVHGHLDQRDDTSPGRSRRGAVVVP